MLNRHDLAKQFELVVQQEIRNHNESLLATNLALNEMRESIEKNKREQDAVNAAISSTITQLNQSSVALSESVLELSKKLQYQINDLNAFMDEMRKGVAISIENSVLAHARFEANGNKISDLEFTLSRLEDDARGIHKIVEREIQESQYKCVAHVDRVKKEILEIPSEAKEVEKNLTGKLEAAYVDFQGLMKEIQIVKKRSFIIDKNLENIYTEIEKLKKG